MRLELDLVSVWDSWDIHCECLAFAHGGEGQMGTAFEATLLTTKEGEERGEPGSGQPGQYRK